MVLVQHIVILDIGECSSNSLCRIIKWKWLPIDITKTLVSHGLYTVLLECY